MRISWGLIDRERDFENHFCLYGGMLMVEGIKRGSPEVMYGEGKKEGRFPKVRTQEEVFFFCVQDVAEHMAIPTSRLNLA